MDQELIASLVGASIGLFVCCAACIVCRIWRRNRYYKKVQKSLDEEEAGEPSYAPLISPPASVYITDTFKRADLKGKEYTAYRMQVTRVDGEVSALRMGVMIIAIAHAFAFIVWMWLTLTQKPPRARDRVKAS